MGPVILALQAGVLAGFLLGWFVIRPLKRNRPYATNIRALRGQRATVQLEARSDFTGTIRALSATGSLVTYDARPVEGVEKIPVGTRGIHCGRRCGQGPVLGASAGE
ncbi:MAG: hypothetical protein ACLSAF_10445 [Intestinimonas sp.]